MPLLRAVGLAMALAAWLVPGLVIAQTQSDDMPRASEARELDRARRETLWVVADGLDETAVRATMDMASVVDDEAGLRVMPVLGEGTAQSVADILYLKGIDIGIVQQDALLGLKKNELLLKLEDRVRYIAKLFNEEIHVVAASDVRHITELAGKKVNFGPASSGTHMTARTVFEALDIEVVPVDLPQELALEKIKSGEIAATVYVSGAPARGLAAVGRGEGLRLVTVPYAPALQNVYLPAALRRDDYPGLIKEGDLVETIAVGTVMAVFNWPKGTARYQRVSRFVGSFFSRFGAFREASRHRKWREVNLAARLPAWSRFEPAETWLTENRGRNAGIVEQDFQSFLSASNDGAATSQVTSSQREALFREFVRWREGRP